MCGRKPKWFAHRLPNAPYQTGFFYCDHTGAGYHWCCMGVSDVIGPTRWGRENAAKAWDLWFDNTY